MTILLDSRIGSKELARYLPAATLTRLESGDASFIGKGPEGPVPIGIERKRVSDLLSSIRDNRLAGHQIPLMLNHYEQVYLVVEGKISFDRMGKVQSYPPLPVALESSALFGFLNSLMVKAGVHVLMTATPWQTGVLIRNLYDWWGREWNSHKTLCHGYSAPPPTALVSPASLLRRIAKELPGIGWGKSKAVEECFKTLPTMLQATIKEWMQIPGIGKRLATLAHQSLHG